MKEYSERYIRSIGLVWPHTRCTWTRPSHKKSNYDAC